MSTFLLTWNPEKWLWENLQDCIRQKDNPQWEFKWSCGNNKSIQQGDRFFIIRLGKDPRGIFASGRAISDSHEEEHYDPKLAEEGKKCHFIKVKFEYLLDSDSESILPRNALNQGILSGMHWDSQSSGVRIPDDIARELEKLWEHILKNKNLQIKTKPERNPPWQRDELILALDLYFRHNPSHINKNHEEVIKLSQILNQLPIHSERKNGNTFRNPNSVYMKLSNFLRYDPSYHGTGLQRGGKLEEDIWNEFVNNLEFLRREVKRIIDTLIMDGSEVAASEEDRSFGENETRRIIDNYSYPLTVSQWVILAPDIFLRTLDRSLLYHHGTVIPIEIREFFDVRQLGRGERRDIILEHHKIRYSAHIAMESADTSRIRMFWKKDFIDLLKRSFPKWVEVFSQKNTDELVGSEEIPKIRFSKDKNKYTVEFINPETIYADIIWAESRISKAREEGEVKYQITKTYERNPANRRIALEIHGLSCVVCGFNFGEVYGELGEGFIHVHHVAPLRQEDRRHLVDPRTDLVPICPNCHAMIDRGKTGVLTVEQLKELIQENKNRVVNLQLDRGDNLDVGGL